jgi:D-sedoheptulose 7-phosphate isomerase
LTLLMYFQPSIDMRKTVEQIFAESIEVKQETLKMNLPRIIGAAEVIISAITSGHKLFFCGNGGSAADSQHIAAEFIGRFQKERKAWPAIALTTDSSALTALGNDYTFDIVFSRQLQALGQKGDVLIAISTSGNSKNVLEALRQAKAMGITTIGVTGGSGGQLAALSDIVIIAASTKTARIQESHLVIFHSICELVENTLAA